ncbi:MAG: hypothetical protein ACJAZS_000819 [Alteromonas naphthalenivorans]|jgi:hypothetical protein
MRKFKLVSKILLSLLLGLVLALAWFQFDERFIALANNGMEKIFENQLDCKFRGRVKRLNPFFLSLDFEDVRVRPFDNKNWSWNAKHMTMRLSFLEYLYYGTFGLHVKLTTLRSLSNIRNGIPTINDHLLNLFAGANFSVPIAFQTVGIVDGKLIAHNEQEKIKFVCCWNSNAGKAGNDFKSKFYISHTSLSLQNKKIFNNFNGQVTFDALHNNRFVRIATDAMLTFPQLPKGQQDCYVMGTWNKNVGSFVLYNQDRTISFVPIEVVARKDAFVINAEGVILADYLKQLWFPDSDQVINGMCCIKLSGDLHGLLHGRIRMQNFGCQDYILDEFYSDFMYSDSLWRGTVSGKKNAAYVSGLWQWSNKSGQGDIKCINSVAVPIFTDGYWECVAGKTMVQAFIKKDGTGTLDYSTVFAHKKTDHQVMSSGTLVSKNDVLEVNGIVDDASYQATIKKDPLWFKSFIYKDAHNKELVSLTTKKNNFSLKADYSIAQEIAHDRFGLDSAGHGIFKVKGVCNYPEVTGTVTFKDGSMRPVGTYNFISDITTRFAGDIKKRTGALEDLNIVLHQGMLKSSKISSSLNSDGSLFALHCPVQFYNCFLNWKKSLYAVCTGASVLQLGSGVQPRIDGFLVLDKSQFKENIFALQTQQNAIQALPEQNTLSDMQIKFAVSTQTPLLVSTSHLQTQAALDCEITGFLRAPALQGALQLRGGKLVFPAHDLAISQGKITFVPAHADDPTIELDAQARIKKYVVKLSVGGTIKDPEVLLQSDPMLSEEQIIMLLLTGSEHESFNIMVPSLVMRNVETIIFGPSKALKHAPTSFSSWLKPLEKVTFTPRFNDQSGRGGFKGVLEVELSKRLRAVLEKDFSLAEDAAAEIEYLASDDVSFKVNRDERGDIGAEVEMRFKF